MPYTAEQQAEISRRFPNIEWINGEPFTRQQTAQNIASYAPDGTPLDYLGMPVTNTGETELVPAELTERFPWEFFALQVAAPALVAGGSAAFGAGGAGGGGGAGATAAAGYGGLPVGTLASAPTAGMIAPSALTAGGVTAGATGGGIAAGTGATYGGLPVGGLSTAPTSGMIAPSAMTAGGGGGGGILSQLTDGWKGKALDLGGRMLSGVTEGMTANRTEQDQRALAQDQMRMQAAGMETSTQATRAQIQMQQQEAAQREQADAYRKALLGQMAANMQDVSLDRSGFQSDIPTISFSGGMRPSVIGALGREAGSTLSTQALDRLQNPTQAEALPTYTAPQLSTPTPASMWEQILSPLAAGSVALGNMNRVAPTTQAPSAQRVG
jgi:hypothetical protein